MATVRYPKFSGWGVDSAATGARLFWKLLILLDCRFEAGDVLPFCFCGGVPGSCAGSYAVGHVHPAYQDRGWRERRGLLFTSLGAVVAQRREGATGHPAQSRQRLPGRARSVAVAVRGY